MKNASEKIFDFGSNPWHVYVNQGMPPKIANSPRHVWIWEPTSGIANQFSGKIYNGYEEGGWISRPAGSLYASFPQSFGDAWLFYQWISEIGPDPAFQTNMTAAEIAAWNASSPIYVLNAETWQSPITNPLDLNLGGTAFWNDIRNQWKFSCTVYANYVAAWLGMDALWPGHVDDWWYLMYALNSTSYGNEVITQWIYDHPEAPAAVIDILRNNDSEQNQQMYGLLNEPMLASVQENIPNDDASMNIYGDGGWTLGNAYAQRGSWNWCYTDTPTPPYFKTLKLSNPATRWGFPLWTYHQRKVAFMTILPAVAVPDGGKWSINSQYLAAYLQIYLDNRWINQDGTIPPIYDPGDPSNPIKVAPPTGGPGGITTKITDPNYAGNLPYATPTAVPGQAPWAGPPGNGKGYSAPCAQKSFLIRAAPAVLAFIATFTTAQMLPESAKISGTLTIGGGTYLLVQQALSLDGDNGETWSKLNAATWISVGAPATLATMVDASDKFPVNKPIFVAAAGAVGYVTLSPKLYEIILDTSGFISPLADTLNRILGFIGTLLDPSCWDPTLSSGCTCANQYSKSQTQQALLNQVYNTSGAQTTMRTKCLQVAMTKGSWGTDPGTVGEPCTGGMMPNPAACMNPAWWTPEYMNFPDPLVKEMFGYISPCLDATNRSFLPPGYVLSGTGQNATLSYDAGLAAKDTACQVHGQYFRSTANGCQNFSNIN